MAALPSFSYVNTSSNKAAWNAAAVTTKIYMIT